MWQLWQKLKYYRTIGARMVRLDAECDALREELEALKSSMEVSRDLVEEFFVWKRTTQVPATPLVSVCVATYNRSRLLTERCIPSVLGQTYPHLELIVVGDGCTDDSERMINQFRDSRLRFMNLPERGRYPEDPRRRWLVAGTQPMNTALALARGDYITHLDDDDEYLPERLEKLVHFAIRQEADFVWHPFWSEEPDGSWRLNDATAFARDQVTTSSVFYRAWFANVRWDIAADRLLEPGDWHRFRRIKYIGPTCRRYSAPLLKHYRERNRPEYT